MPLSQWLKLMLAEIERKSEERARATEELERRMRERAQERKPGDH